MLLLEILLQAVLISNPSQEAYVNNLKEDKLRALGVDEHIPSKSPAISVMSRQGSSQSSVLTSPVLASLSHVGPFPASFYGAANPASYTGKPGASHFPRYSMAHTPNEPSFVSPTQFSQPSEPNVYGTSSPRTHLASQQGSRVASPGANGHIQEMEQAPPSAFPIGTNSLGQVSNQASVDLLARMREHQALLQIQQLQQQQQQHHLQQILQQRSLPSLSMTQNGERVLQPVAHYYQANIATPIARGRGSNPNETLKNGVDQAQAHVSYSMSEKEGRENSNVAQDDEGNDAYQAKDTSNDIGRAAPQNVASALDAGLGVRAIADHGTDQYFWSQGRSSSKASQLNVNAPRFEPRMFSGSGVFSFSSNQQAHKAVEIKPRSLSRSHGTSQAPNSASQTSKWNVAAPAFMPKAPVVANPPSREFSFSALRPSLRPDAPAFKPSDSRNVFGPKPTSEQNTVQPANRIFGDIKFPEVIKLTRSKAIPITKPNEEWESKETPNKEVDGQEDESGRITQADGRQKRLRYVILGISLHIQSFISSRKTHFEDGKGAFAPFAPPTLCYLVLFHFV